VTGGVGDGDVVDAVGEVLVLVALRAAVQRDVALGFINVSVYDAAIVCRGPDCAGKGVGGRGGAATERGQEKEDRANYKQLDQERCLQEEEAAPVYFDWGWFP
jgi:hypothetical protein